MAAIGLDYSAFQVSGSGQNMAAGLAQRAADLRAQAANLDSSDPAGAAALRARAAKLDQKVQRATPSNAPVSNTQAWFDAVGQDGFSGRTTTRSTAQGDSFSRAVPRGAVNLQNPLALTPSAPAPVTDAQAAQSALNNLAPLTQADAQTIGSGFGKTVPPQTFWTDTSVNIVLADGMKQNGITHAQMAANVALSSTILGVQGQPSTSLSGAPLQLTPADMAAAVRASGVPLAQQDPAQLIAATKYVNSAKDIGTQQQYLSKALDNFDILNSIGVPKLSQQEVATISVDALNASTTTNGKQNNHGVDSAMLDSAMGDPTARAQAFQNLAAAANGAPGSQDVKVGDYDVKFNVGQSGTITGTNASEPGFWSKVGSVMGVVGKVALDVACVVPSPIMPFAIAANAALGAYSAAKTGNWAGVAIDVAGAFAGGVGSVASIADDSVSAGLSAAANIAGNASQIAGTVNQGVNAIENHSALGLVNAVTNGAVDTAGLVSGIDPGLADNLQNFAGTVNNLRPAAGVVDAFTQGNLSRAVGLGASYASSFAPAGSSWQSDLGLVSQGAGVVNSFQGGNLYGALRGVNSLYNRFSNTSSADPATQAGSAGPAPIDPSANQFDDTEDA